MPPESNVIIYLDSKVPITTFKVLNDLQKLLVFYENSQIASFPLHTPITTSTFNQQPANTNTSYSWITEVQEQAGFVLIKGQHELRLLHHEHLDPNLAVIIPLESVEQFQLQWHISKKDDKYIFRLVIMRECSASQRASQVGCELLLYVYEFDTHASSQNKAPLTPCARQVITASQEAHGLSLLTQEERMVVFVATAGQVHIFGIDAENQTFTPTSKTIELPVKLMTASNDNNAVMTLLADDRIALITVDGVVWQFPRLNNTYLLDDQVRFLLPGKDISLIGFSHHGILVDSLNGQIISQFKLPKRAANPRKQTLMPSIWLDSKTLFCQPWCVILHFHDIPEEVASKRLQLRALPSGLRSPSTATKLTRKTVKNTLKDWRDDDAEEQRLDHLRGKYNLGEMSEDQMIRLALQLSAPEGTHISDEELSDDSELALALSLSLAEQ